MTDDQLIGTNFIETSLHREMTIALQTERSVVLLYINAYISQEKFADVLKSKNRVATIKGLGKMEGRQLLKEKHDKRNIPLSCLNLVVFDRYIT